MSRFDRRHLLKLGGAAVAAFAAGKSSGKSSKTPLDAIVVGAGASGCSVAWHLREKGLSVLVLEAGKGPATQASHNAAGFVAHWSAIWVPEWGETEWQMQHYGIDFYARRAAAASNIGLQTGFVATGIAYIYRSSEKLDKAQARIKQARQMGTRLEMLTEKRCKAILPQIEFSQVAGIAYDPDSVRVRASDMIPALAQLGAREGVQFSYGEPVLELVSGGVRTANRSYFAKSVIVTAGAWSRPLLEKAGRHCPARPEAEIRYTTRSLPGIRADMPLLIFVDDGFYIREERSGLLIGGGDAGSAPDRQIDPSDPPTVDKLKVDEVYRIRQHIKQIEPLMPSLKTAEIDQIAGGIPTYTDDVHFIADAVPGQDGLYVVTGCQEAGITHGPALGRLMSELVTAGTPSWNRDRFRLTRFSAAPV